MIAAKRAEGGPRVGAGARVGVVGRDKPTAEGIRAGGFVPEPSWTPIFANPELALACRRAGLVAHLAVGDAVAPDFDITHTQRLLIRADTRDLGFNRTIGLVDFIIPVDGESTTGVGVTREIVVMEACIACHGDPLEHAGHGSSGSGYQSPQACNICHTPIGDEYGDVMQRDGAWLANLIHGIHQETTDTTDWDWSEVTYPRHPSDCGVCHFDAGQDLADEWTNPKPETCATCHVSEAALTHMASVDPSLCLGCHNDLIAPAVATAHEVTTLKDDPAHEGNVVSNIPAYTASLDLTPPANDTHYVAGEEILVTVTTSNADDGDYTNPDGPFTRANIYVYGPRANPVPILTPGSTTDPAFDPDTMLADQGRSMLIDDAADDAQIETDDGGFKYRLQAIPDDLAPGTYMVMAYVTHGTECSAWYRTSTCIDGWVYDTIQIGTATEELRVSGDCSGCHDPQDWTSFYHRSYFGTDGCIACHDQSGNHANYLSNRVHAVHSASVTGDLGDADWSEITFPRNAYACEACHTSGNESYLADPVPVRWGVACLGCHGDTSGARDHMIQNGSVFGEH